MRVEQREVLQEQLIGIILDVLRRNPQLHYYQGYHDIVVTFLLVVGERMSIAIVETLSKHHLRWGVELGGRIHMTLDFCDTGTRMSLNCVSSCPQGLHGPHHGQH